MNIYCCWSCKTLFFFFTFIVCFSNAFKKNNLFSIYYRKLNLSPDEQEVTYELKAQLMRNIEMQNQKLKTELTLHEKMNESKLLNQQNRKLHEDSTLSRTNTLRLMKMFEKKAKDGNCRFNWIYLSFLWSDW